MTEQDAEAIVRNCELNARIHYSNEFWGYINRSVGCGYVATMRSTTSRLHIYGVDDCECDTLEAARAFLDMAAQKELYRRGNAQPSKA